MRQGFTPQESCEMAVERIIAKHEDLTGLQVGFLALDKFGNVGAHSVYYGFNYAIQTAKMEKMIDASYDRNW
jgi:isoaspartyl peptidase/L-asparaginase-like protein (Ntn-hydrolase superfamily)